MVLPRIAVAVVISVLWRSATGATHCGPEEIVYFSCKISGSSKVVSLCGSPLIDSGSSALRKDGWLQYRFGIPGGKPELLYPAAKTNSTKHFKGEALSYLGEGNARSYNSRIWFNSGKAHYGVVVDQGDEHFVGIRVTVGEKRVSLPCEAGINQIDFGSADGNNFTSLSRSLDPIE